MCQRWPARDGKERSKSRFFNTWCYEVYKSHTIVCQKYVNDDGSGPEPVSREQELQNMSLIIALRNAFPRILEERQELKRKIEGMKRVDKNIFSARIVNDEWVREIQVNPIVSTYNEAIDDVLKLFEE